MLTIQATAIEHVNYCVCGLLSERGGNLRRIVASCNPQRICTESTSFCVDCDENYPLCNNAIPFDDGCEVPCGEPIISCDDYNYALQCPCCECQDKKPILCAMHYCGFDLLRDDLPDGSREDRIIALLSQVTNSSLLSQPSSPQAMAASWIINKDDLAVETSSIDERRSLVQRYALSVLYFATNGDDWLYCSAKENSECGSSRFPGRERFLSNTSECDWAGVECSDEFIFSIQLGKRWLSVLVSLVIGLIYIKVDANISGFI